VLFFCSAHARAAAQELTMSKLPYLGSAFDPAVVSVIELVTTANRTDLWLEHEVASAREALVAEYGKVPALDDLAARFGAESVVTTARQFVQKREALVEVIRFVTKIAKPDHWPGSEVGEAHTWLTNVYGQVPTLEDLAEQFGEETVIGIANKALAERTAAVEDATERLGIGSNCHLCGATRAEQDPFYDFGLAHILSKKRDWASAAGTLAFNIVTVPLGVVVAPRGISSSTTAKVARCRLVLCKGCGREHSSWLGTLKIAENDCSKHPSWARLVTSGYSKFLDSEELAKYRPA
jgi:hypothetical protein